MTIPESDWPEWAKYLTIDWRGFVFHEHEPFIDGGANIRPMYWSEGRQERLNQYIGPVIKRGEE